MRWIEEKMKLLGCDKNPNYNLSFYLDSRAMISIQTEKYGIVDVKPLGVIWGKYPQYDKKTTIMFDDLRRNFLMNPQQGLKIRAFRCTLHTNDGYSPLTEMPFVGKHTRTEGQTGSWSAWPSISLSLQNWMISPTSGGLFQKLADDQASHTLFQAQPVGKVQPGAQLMQYLFS